MLVCWEKEREELEWHLTIYQKQKKWTKNLSLRLSLTCSLSCCCVVVVSNPMATFDFEIKIFPCRHRRRRSCIVDEWRRRRRRQVTSEQVSNYQQRQHNKQPLQNRNEIKKRSMIRLVSTPLSLWIRRRRRWRRRLWWWWWWWLCWTCSSCLNL